MGDYIIYRAVNVGTGAEYIGATKRGLEVRRREHYRDAPKPTPGCRVFRAAILKYGEDAFRWEIIAGGLSYEQAMLREIEEIATRKPRYNITSGGSGLKGIPRTPEWTEKVRAKLKGRKMTEAQKQKLKACRPPLQGCHAITCLEDGNVFQSHKAAAEFYGINAKSIGCSIAYGHKCGGQYHFVNGALTLTDKDREEAISARKEKTAQNRGRTAISRSRPVVSLTTNRIFPSATSAAKFFGILQSRVIQICQFGGQTREGLRFRYEDCEEVTITRSEEAIEAGRLSRIRKLKERRHPPETIARMKAAAQKRGVSLSARRARIANQQKPIRCIETGQIFAHAQEAADKFGMKRSRVYALVRQPGHKCGAGFSFAHA